MACHQSNPQVGDVGLYAGYLGGTGYYDTAVVTRVVVAPSVIDIQYTDESGKSVTKTNVSVSACFAANKWGCYSAWSTCPGFAARPKFN